MDLSQTEGDDEICPSNAQSTLSAKLSSAEEDVHSLLNLIMDGIASEIVLTHGVPLSQDVRLFSVLRREYKRLCAALRSFDLWFCMRDGVARNVCARSAGICAHRALHSIGKCVIA